jgi:hypothetical protein
VRRERLKYCICREMRGCVGAIIVVVVNFLRILVRAWQHFVAIRKETVKEREFGDSTDAITSTTSIIHSVS